MTNRLLPPLAMALVTLFSGAAMAQPGPDGACGFRHADANNDGKVTLDEALAHGKAMFELRDKNKDGVLTRDEIPGRGANFAGADTNNDGKVTFAEHEAFLRSRFATMDQNKDGVLSGDELNCGGRSGPRGRGGRGR